MDNNIFKYSKDEDVITIKNNDNLLSVCGYYLNNENIEKVSSLIEEKIENPINFFDKETEDHKHNLRIFNNPDNYNSLSTFLSWNTKLLSNIPTIKKIGCYRNGVLWFEDNYFFILTLNTNKIYAFELLEENEELYKLCSQCFVKNDKRKSFSNLFSVISEDKEILNKYSKFKVIENKNPSSFLNLETFFSNLFLGNPFSKMTFYTPVNTDYIKNYKISYDNRLVNLGATLNLDFYLNKIIDNLKIPFTKDLYDIKDQFKNLFRSSQKNKYQQFKKNFCEYVYIDNKPILVFRKFSFILSKPNEGKKAKVLETARHYVDPFTKKCYVQFYSKDYIFEWKQFDYSKFFTRLFPQYILKYKEKETLLKSVFNFLCNPFSDKSLYRIDLSKDNYSDRIIDCDDPIPFLYNNYIYNQSYDSKNTRKYQNFKDAIMKKHLELKLYSIIKKEDFTSNKLCYFERINTHTIVYRFFVFDLFLGMREYLNVFVNKKDTKCFLIMNDKLIPYKGENPNLFNTCLVNNIDLQGTFLSFIDQEIIDKLNKRKLNISIVPFLSVCCYHSQIIEHLLKLKFYNIFFMNKYGWSSSYFPHSITCFNSCPFLYFKKLETNWSKSNLKFNSLFSEPTSQKIKNSDFNKNNKLYQLLSRPYNRSSVADLSINTFLSFPIKKLIPIKDEIESFDQLLNYVIFANLINLNNKDDKRIKILKRYSFYNEIMVELNSTFWKKVFINKDAKFDYVIKLMSKINFELFPVQYLDCLRMYYSIFRHENKDKNISKEEMIKHKTKFLKKILKMNDERFFRLHVEFLNKTNQNSSNYQWKDESVLRSPSYLYNEYSDDDYCVLAPKSFDDIATEGFLMKHCVATYIPYVEKEKTQIYFIRKREFSSIPLVTIEIKNKELRQAYAYNDSLITDENIKRFMRKWIKIKNLKDSHNWT